ncbi:hypothetical protein AC579_7366 [Pseudocercospora musae]|uniref:Uncharacterized protein n=1 Tax=Pseudocercospora musae TaxID=113226 RepID=A0A139ID00_9PEZI|nr:hypothetical protein AC579_7366 [Pseudocercospora musae]
MAGVLHLFRMSTIDSSTFLAAWDSLLETVHIMSASDLTTIHRPPDEGWDLRTEQIASISAAKTPAVLSLIKRLSYADYTHLAPDTVPINYTSKEGLEPKDGTSPRPWSNPDKPVDILPSELPLTTQNDSIGTLLILVTDTGNCISRSIVHQSLRTDLKRLQDSTGSFPIQ